MTQVVEIERLNGKTVPYFHTLREADEEECRAAGLSPHDALSQSVRLSTASFALMVGSDVLLFWGYAAPSLLGPTCHAWMLTTPLADAHRIYIGRESRRVVRVLLTMYPTIHIVVDRQHRLARKWLKWLGFHPFERFGRFIEMRATRGKDFVPWAF